MSTTVPGVYLSEVLSPPPASGGVSTSLGCFVGPHPRGPLVPTRVTSFQRFTNLYGGFVPGVAASDMLYAAYLFFNNGGREAYFTRVPDGNEVVASIALTDNEPTASGPPATPRTTLTVSAANPGSWGNALSVDVDVDAGGESFSLVVYYGGASVANVVERFTSLSMDPADPRYVVGVINSPDQGSAYITVLDALLDSAVDLALRTPAATTTPVALASGADASGSPTSTKYDDALALLDAINGPLNINLPGETSAALVNKALSYAVARTNSFVVVDGLAASTVAQQATRTGLYNSTSYGAAYFPRAVISDPASRSLGATKVVPLGGAIIGKYADIDASESVAKAPAGFDTRISGAVGLEVPLTDADLASLQNSRTNAIRNIPGAGVVIMGARTLTTGAQVDRYIAARRTLIYIKSELKSILSFALFANNDALLQQRAYNLTDKFLRELWSAKGLRGASEDEAYFVVCDDTINDATSRNNGELRVKVGVALQTPAEFIVIEVGQFDGVVNAVEVA